MIVAAGLTPAWQQILVLDGLRVGEVNRAREAHSCSSGKVLNVGLALHHLGGPSVTVALVGGITGESIDRELAELGIARKMVRARRPTRSCTTILDQATGVTTELVENAGPVGSEEIAEFLRVYDEVAHGARMVVLSGSLPPGAPTDFYKDLMARTRSRFVLDARGPELLEALALGPLCVKPNREELGKTLGRELDSDAELKEAMRETVRLGAEWVVVSSGEGRLWAMSNGGLHAFRPACVRSVNPIGCGDCLAAGIAWSLEHGSNMLDAIRFGMAAAAENAAALLPARLSLESVRRRMADVVRED